MATLVAVGLGAIAFATGVRDARSATGSNVVFILTDDQSVSELAGMPNVQNLIGAAGATFNRAYIPYPLCCPSRASLLSGRYMHNHGVRGNLAPNGGWERFQAQEASALPARTANAGYYNVHVGKYMNNYFGTAGSPRIPPGWSEWYGKISEDNLYFNFTTIEKEGPTDTSEVAFYATG